MIKCVLSSAIAKTNQPARTALFAHCVCVPSHRIEGNGSVGTWWIVSVNSAVMHSPLHTCAGVTTDPDTLPQMLSNFHETVCLMNLVYSGNETREFHTRLQVVYVEMSLKPSPSNVVQKLLLQYKKKSSQLLYNSTSRIKSCYSPQSLPYLAHLLPTALLAAISPWFNACKIGARAPSFSRTDRHTSQHRQLLLVLPNLHLHTSTGYVSSICLKCKPFCYRFSTLPPVNTRPLDLFNLPPQQLKRAQFAAHKRHRHLFFRKQLLHKSFCFPSCYCCCQWSFRWLETSPWCWEVLTGARIFCWKGRMEPHHIATGKKYKSTYLNNLIALPVNLNCNRGERECFEEINVDEFRVLKFWLFFKHRWSVVISNLS